MHKSKKMIDSMFGEKILLYTPLLKWYLEHSLIITKFYEAIEYYKNVCFKELGESIADARRAGDADKSMEIIAETMKLIGNSLMIFYFDTKNFVPKFIPKFRRAITVSIICLLV